MKHTYYIHGMTCNGCRSHVEATLSKVEGVTNASVDLEKAEATIEMESHIPFERFQDALENDGGSYSIHKQGEHPKTEEPKKEKPKNQKPLPFLVEAFDWDGMGGNIGGLSVYVLALDIMYSALVE